MDTLTRMADAPVSDSHRKVCAAQIDLLAQNDGRSVEKVEWSEHDGIIHFIATIGGRQACIGAPKAA